MPAIVARLKERVRPIKRDTLALYLACRDPRTPWYARALAGLVVAYALSPIDLIPDFVPVFGYLDDLIIVPGGIVLAAKLIPGPVMKDARKEAARMATRPTSRTGAAIIAGIWLAAAALSIYLLADALDLF